VLGVELTVRAVFDAPTPAAMAALLDDGSADRDAFGVLLPLRRAGARPPLFCLPPIAGTSWRYAGLLRALDPDVPLYALQSRGLTGQRPLPATMPQLLDDYAGLIRSVQPEGPYHLVGWSFGGNLAHGLAARMAAEGDRVALLAILDAYPAEPGRRGRTDRRTLLADMFREYATVYDGGDVQVPPDDPALRAGVVDYLGRGRSELRYLDPEQRSCVLDVMLNNAAIALADEPPRYPGDMVLVVAGRSRKDWATPESWKALVQGDIRVHEVDARHEDLMDPGSVEQICAVLRAELPVAAERGAR